MPSPSEARWGAGVGRTGAGKQASSASCWTLFITYLQDKKDVRVMKTCAQKVFVSSHYLYRGRMSKRESIGGLAGTNSSRKGNELVWQGDAIRPEGNPGFSVDKVSLLTAFSGESS